MDARDFSLADAADSFEDVEPLDVLRVCVDDALEVRHPLADPPWDGVCGPIRPDEIVAAIEVGDLEARMVGPGIGVALRDARAVHIARIAHFVIHGIPDPIVIHVGMPSFPGSFPPAIVDGHHRLAAAAFRGDRHILVVPEGELSAVGSLFPGAVFVSGALDTGRLGTR